MLASLESAQSKVEQMVGFGKRKNSKTGELEHTSTSAHQEARRLSISRNSGPGNDAARAQLRESLKKEGKGQGGSALEDGRISGEMGRRGSAPATSHPLSPKK